MLTSHVGARVLDRLERPDRATELMAHLRVAPRSRTASPRHRPRLSHAIATAARVEQPRTRVGRVSVELHARRRHLAVADTVASRRVSSRTGRRGRRSWLTQTTPLVGDHAEPGPRRRRRARTPVTRATTANRTAPDGHIGEQLVASIAGLQRIQGARRPALRCRGSCSCWRRGPSPRRSTATSANVAPAPPNCVGHLQADPARVDERRPFDARGPWPSRSPATDRSSSWNSSNSGAIRPRSAPAAARGRARR